MNFAQADRKHIAHTYTRFDLQAVSGKGAVCTDVNGREYIDFSSGIGVNTLGFCDAGWVEAVCTQAQKLQHISNLYYTEPMVQLAQTLCTRTFAQKVFFANSGAEANEGMIKLARKYSTDRYGKGRHTIVALQNSFHGRTITTLSATGQEVFHRHFGPFTDGFAFAAADEIDDLRSKLDSSVCAVLIEPIQGEGGVLPLTQAFASELVRLCAERDILLLVDEVQTGIGRTGKLLCCEHYGIQPDAASVAKGLGGGLPIGAVLIGERCESTLGTGDHGTTYGGNPVACAGASEVLRRLDEALLTEVAEKGEYITRRLLKMPGIAAVTGRGLMLGILLTQGNARKTAEACLEEGLIILTAKEKLRMLPPLTISYAEIDEGLKKLNGVLCR